MKKLFWITLITLITINNTITNAQLLNVDSLRAVLNATVKDTNYVNTMKLLNRQYLIMGMYDSCNVASKRYITLTDALSKKATDASLKKILRLKNGGGYMDLGVTCIYMNSLDSAIVFMGKAKNIFIEVNDQKGVASCYNNMGAVYKELGNYPMSLKYNYEALKIREKMNDKKGLGDSYNNIAIIYLEQNNYKEALAYQNKALKIRLEINDMPGIATSYNNIGSIYKTMKNDTCLYYYQKSLELRRQQGDKRETGIVLSNMGAYYFEHEKNNDKALEAINEAIEIQKEIGDIGGLATNYANISSLNMGLKKAEKAREYALMSLELSKSIGFKLVIRDAYLQLSRADSLSGNYKDAYVCYQNYIAYRDSIANDENSKILLQSQIQYEFDKKEALAQSERLKKEALLLEEKKRERIMLFSSIGGFLLVLVFLIFVANRLKITRKQNVLIEQQKSLVELKNHEITQSIQYAQKIQAALLPSEEMFKTILPDSFVLFKPKDIVSGDFYWISYKHDKYIFYATADSTGHGVPGGFMSMLGTALLNEIIDERRMEDCGEVLTLMREKIMQALKQAGDSESKDGMDMVLIRIDKLTLEMQYAAANNSMYLVSNMQSAVSNEYCLLQTANCQFFELPCDKMPVGVYHSEVKPFRTYTHQVQKGDIIYTYTDGYADQFGGEKGKKYTYKKLREKLVAISQEPLAKQKTILENEFESWRAGQEQIDDVCLIGVKI